MHESKLTFEVSAQRALGDLVSCTLAGGLRQPLSPDSPHTPPLTIRETKGAHSPLKPSRWAKKISTLEKKAVYPPALLPKRTNVSDSEEHIFIAGAGVAGCFTALELAKIKTPDGSPKYKITLVDKNSQILRGSSDVTPGRMGLGFQNVHKPTALMYLRATVEFQRKYSSIKDFTVGAALPKDSPMRHALRRERYFMAKDSKPSKPEMLETYSALQEEYAKLVAEDSANKVFGEPKDFFRILDPAEYADYVVMDKVDVGIETAECLLDWKEFRKFIIAKLNRHENIEISTGITVSKIVPDKENCSYTIQMIEDTGIEKEDLICSADAVVNCTWENARALNATAGLTKLGTRTNHLNAVVIVRLPDSLKDVSSAFFCMEPHAMFSNLGDGFGAMTYAPRTSMMSSTELVVPESINKYLSEGASLDEKEDIAIKVKAGVARYIKGIEQAEIVEVRFGIVQTNGEVDILDHKSEFGRRDYNGISVELLNFVTNACMKLLYGPENGEIVKDILKEQMQESAAIKKYLASLDQFAESKNSSNKVGKRDLDLLRFAMPKRKLKAQIAFFDRKMLQKVTVPEIKGPGKVVADADRKRSGITFKPLSSEGYAKAKEPDEVTASEVKEVKMAPVAKNKTGYGRIICDGIYSFFCCGKSRRKSDSKDASTKASATVSISATSASPSSL